MKGVKDNKIRKNVDLSKEAIVTLTKAAAEKGLVFKPYAEQILEDIAKKKQLKK